MIINLLSGPRNISTALMYSFAQRSDTAVIDEPFYAWYLSRTDAQHPGREEVLKEQSDDYREVLEAVVFSEQDRPNLFLKNMAHHHVDMEYDYLEKVHNIFLIRSPEEMITSFIKNIPDPTLRDTAYDKQVELMEYLQEAGQDLLVVDSAELLKNPEEILGKVCRRLEIPFERTMLKWEAGPRPEDGSWAKFWYHSVHKSTGFKPYSPKKEKVPGRLQPLLEECERYYGELYEHAIR